MWLFFRIRRTVLVVALTGLFVVSAKAQITSDFASNAEGWTAPNTLAGIAYSSTGGNPSGYVSAVSYNYVLGAGTVSLPLFFVAPSKFSGNFSGYLNGTLRYDLQQSSTAGSELIQAEAILSNGTTTLYYYPPIPFAPAVAPTWTTFAIPLNEDSGYWRTSDSNTGAAATNAQILSVLTNLTSLQIKGRSRTSVNTGSLDNVGLTPPIIITTQPASTAVCEGANATLTTAATGNPVITYQWQKQSSSPVAVIWNNVANAGGYSGATSASLVVNTTGNFGAGNYRCKISAPNAIDEYTNNAVIGINPLPTAPTTTGNSSCTTGALTLTAAGGTNGQYRWYTAASGGTAITGQTNSTYSPALTGTTTYYVSINNGTCESTRTAVTGTINTPPNAPTTTGASSCSAATLTLTAAGGTNGQYRWYTVASGGTAITGQTSSTYSPALTGTTTYYVSINNGTCESTRTAVTGTINTPPNAPTTTGASSCSAASLTLTAAGGTNGQYRWYTVASGGTAITGQTSSTYSPALTGTTTYYVSINNGTCESTRTAVTGTINTPPNAPTTTGASSCSAATLTLTAAGGTNGQYQWYTLASGGTAIAGQTSSVYTTPVLTATTTYYVSIHNGTCESTRTAVTATVGTTLTPPSASGVSSCTAGPLTLTATGGTNGQYRWYLAATGGTAIAGQNSNTYTTPSLTSTTTYYVSLNNGSCESTRTPVTATIDTPPAAPTVTGNASCTASALTLTAAGGASGQYRWYTDASTGSPIAGELNATYTTPTLTSTTTYYVAVNNGTCESSRTAVVATIGCVANEAPVIAPTPITAPIEGKVTLNLAKLISDKEGNQDLTTLKVTVPPSSGATATIDPQYNLILDYTGISFSGTEKLTIQVCDQAGACAQRELSIDVIGDVQVYNALSPNNDGQNEFLFLQYIDVLEDTKKNKVSVFGRWGDLVFDIEDYNNTTKIFKGLNNSGHELPSGTYFYKIEFAGNRKPLTGYLTLKR